MPTSLTERLAEAASLAAPSAEQHARNREAWNLPQGSVTTASAHRGGLDWDRFRDLYYPDSRRHDLTAIAAYGAYKRSPDAGRQPAGETASSNGARVATELVSHDLG